MDESNYEKSQDLLWKRKLTPAEEAQLQALLLAHPEKSAEWDEDRQLNQLLDGLPTVPVSSNFTSLVLQSIERENSASARASAPQRPWWQVLWPKTAMASSIALCLTLGLFVYRNNLQNERQEMADSIAAVSSAAAHSSSAILEDFDAIQHLNSAPSADTELLALMQ